MLEARIAEAHEWVAIKMPFEHIAQGEPAFVPREGVGGECPPPSPRKSSKQPKAARSRRVRWHFAQTPQLRFACPSEAPQFRNSWQQTLSIRRAKGKVATFLTFSQRMTPAPSE